MNMDVSMRIIRIKQGKGTITTQNLHNSEPLKGYPYNTDPQSYLPRVEKGCLVQGYPERSHNDQFKQQTQQQRDDSSDQQSYNQGLQNLHKQSSSMVV